MQKLKALIDTYIPDAAPRVDALKRTTHLGIGAHSDDLEIMAFHGIAECYERADKWFTGMTCTDGRGSSRTGRFENYSDQQMVDVRRDEQRAAARLGGYSAMVQYGLTSDSVKSSKGRSLVDLLLPDLSQMQPEIIYLHNPLDKHPTHLSVLHASIEALRALPKRSVPPRVFGCEAWRALDWVCDEEKVALEVDGFDALAEDLVRVFDSQISGGKAYDRAALGRRHANATFFHAHRPDGASQINFAIDLSELLRDPSLDLIEYTLSFIDRFRVQVLQALTALK